MIKIIRASRNNKPVIKCNKKTCGRILEFDVSDLNGEARKRSDILGDYYGGMQYIICPSCKTEVFVKS